MLTYATFITGLQDPISNWIKQEKHRVKMILDGACLFEASTNRNKIINEPYFFNMFSVLSQGAGTIEHLMKKVLLKPPQMRKSRGTFRIVTSKENQLIAVDKKLRNDVEMLITAKTGMIPERRGGGKEFWFLSRSEGITLFMERHPPVHIPNEMNKSKWGPVIFDEKKLKKGELRPQLAYCLNRLAEPSPDDVMIDPFCGYGAVTRSRAIYFPCREIHALDIKPAVKNIKKADIRDLPSIFPPQSVDVIVTDPPWGLYDNEADISALYASLSAACKYVLKPGGRAVILTAQKEILQNWQPEARYDILVSGQKAAIFVIRAEAN